MFSNPLGLNGHDLCVSEAGLDPVLGGEARVGQCYNELECLASGGMAAGYCPDGPGSNILVSDDNNPQHEGPELVIDQQLAANCYGSLFRIG